MSRWREGRAVGAEIHVFLNLIFCLACVEWPHFTGQVISLLIATSRQQSVGYVTQTDCYRAKTAESLFMGSWGTMWYMRVQVTFACWLQ